MGSADCCSSRDDLTGFACIVEAELGLVICLLFSKEFGSVVLGKVGGCLKARIRVPGDISLKIWSFLSLTCNCLMILFIGSSDSR